MNLHRKNRLAHIAIIVSIVWIAFGVGTVLVYYLKHRTPTHIVTTEDGWPEKDMLRGKPFSKNYQGVDLSVYQGRMFWEEMTTQNEGLQFVYLRAVGSKSKADKNYALNLQKANEHNIPVGSYIFFDNRYSVREQFEVFRNTATEESQNLIPVIDVEEKSLRIKNYHLRDSVLAMARMMEKEYGVKPIIYSNENFYIHHLSPTFDNYKLWIANYSRLPHINGVEPILWQFSEKGHIHGVWTRVDLNCFIHGATLKDLRI